VLEVAIVAFLKMYYDSTIFDKTRMFSIFKQGAFCFPEVKGVA